MSSNFIEKQQIWIVEPFQLYPIPESANFLVYLAHSSAKIVHRPLINVLQKLKDHQIKRISSNQFKELAEKNHLSAEDSLPFLVNELRIFSMQAKKPFDCLTLLTDNVNIAKALESHLDYLTVIINPDKQITSNSITLIFNERYNKDNYMLPQTNNPDANCYFLTAYVYHHYLMIDNFYAPKKGLPCHFCNLYREQELLTKSEILSADSWLQFYQSFINYFPQAIPALPLTRAQENLIVFYLASTLENYLLPNKNGLLFREALDCLRVDLINGKAVRQTAYPWAYCGCLSG